MRLIEIGADSYIYADVDGDAQADFALRVVGVTGLTAADFDL